MIDLKSEHVPDLLAAKTKFQDDELLTGTIVALIFYATPRLGEVLNMIYWFVILTLRWKVVTKKLLIHLVFFASSLHHSQISYQIKQALKKSRVNFTEIVGISVDYLGTNTSAHSMIESSEHVK